MMPYVIPAKVEVVAVVRIYTNLQQFTFDARASETTSCVLIVPIGEIPEQVIAPAIDERQLFFRQPVQAFCREENIIV